MPANEHAYDARAGALHLVEHVGPVGAPAEVRVVEEADEKPRLDGSRRRYGSTRRLVAVAQVREHGEAYAHDAEGEKGRRCCAAKCV